MSSLEPATAWDVPGEGATPEPRYAGFWIRAVAVVLDAFIFSVPLTIVLAVVGQAETSLGQLIGLVASAAYSIVLWVRWGRTVGGAIVGLRLVRVDGEPVTYSTAGIRYAMLFVSFFVLLIGVIWVAFHPKKQGWMDLVAGTYVIHDERRE